MPPEVDQFSSLIALPAIGIVTVATLLLLCVIRTKRKDASTRSVDERAVTLALTATSCMYALFGTVSYSLAFYAYMIVTVEKIEELIFFLGIAQILNSFGVILRSPILLVMKPMRKSLKRGLGMA
ncbi:uncharacterized protein LOC142342292 [Convolutriloba macropyga]|uniref:uncharacterized protein LOC142342292 n=1 Tax=Convolutriloba macropyga TaxID=536237 RepID=UPI003F525AB8